MKMLVIGDVGRACLFDISMGAKESMKDSDRQKSGR
jgi:hypothetical protein